MVTRDTGAVRGKARFSTSVVVKQDRTFGELRIYNPKATLAGPIFLLPTFSPLSGATHMTEIVLWLIAFALILYYSIKMWETKVSAGLNKVMPRVIKNSDENRWVWSLALATLGATTLVRPIDILLTVILLLIAGLIAWKVTSWAMSNVNF